MHVTSKVVLMYTGLSMYLCTYVPRLMHGEEFLCYFIEQIIGISKFGLKNFVHLETRFMTGSF